MQLTHNVDPDLVLRYQVRILQTRSIVHCRSSQPSQGTSNSSRLCKGGSYSDAIATVQPCTAAVAHLCQASQLLLGQLHDRVDFLSCPLEVLHSKGKGADVGDSQLSAPLQRINQLQIRSAQ